ncbi:MAG: beta-Ala-His dipeptidase [Schwartzia sp.]|nr:beta-Ala-His dipeptidase [Schwartzia sp. (in: firmicutes)]
MESNKEIIDRVLDEFMPLTKIPRPSGHEKAVSDYLKGIFEGIGCSVVQDAVNNIIADLPATKGFENAPLTILQSHMDMVCVAEKGREYNPLTDEIKTIRTEEYLTADGTSLGSDDGSGISEIIYIFKTLEKHGPLRAIITVDEEVGMLGTEKLDAKYVQDASFYINCDSEEDDLLTIGSAGSLDVEFHREIHWGKTPEGKAWKASVKGLLGGHSGERIGDGRGNALRVLGQLMLELGEAGISFAVSSMEGGQARNAIADSASFTFVSSADEKEILKVLDNRKKRFLEAYGAVDPGMHIELSADEKPERVMSDEDVRALAELLVTLHTGIFAMSAALPGLVETSANIGMLRMTDKEVWFSYYPRSSVDYKLDSFSKKAIMLGERFGCPAKVGTPSPAWHERTDSKLAEIITEVFEEQHGAPMRVASIHAGLECSWMVKRNPKLDVVSVGVTTYDIHSPKERLLLSTVASQVKMIKETLRRIADM